MGLSSHEYEIDVTGEGRAVLTFTFNNINLPDSTTDELNSQGFVKFKIAPYNSLPNGTVLVNSADIYFDFNLPISTNQAWVTVFDTTLIGNSITVTIVTLDTIEDGIPYLSTQDINIIPNPFNDNFQIKLSNVDQNKLMNLDIMIIDLLGKKIVIKSEIDENLIVEGSQLEKGVFFLQFIDRNSGSIVGRKKVVKY